MASEATMETAVNNLSITKGHDQRSIGGHRLIENGQVIYHEDRLRIENHKMFSSAIVHFREWRANVESTNTNIRASDIPQEYTYLIAMLAHESDESLKTLANRLNDLLSPFDKNNEASFYFFKAIKQIIKVAAYQERYGLADAVLLLKGSPSTMPKRLSIFRWQVHDTTKFPSDVIKAAMKKREKRILFSTMLTKAFQSLSANEKTELLYDENGSFIVESSSDPAMDTSTALFSNFKQNEFVSLAPIIRQSRRRLCSSFDTLFYVGLNNSFDLRLRFLEELSPEAKLKRGPTIKKVDLKQAWLESIRTGVVTHKMRGIKMKLLQFHEDVRPAYYGTWTKGIANTHAVVTGRNPFSKDKGLDYDYDSEAEWDHDVEGDDIYTLDPDEDEDILFPTDEEDEGEAEISNFSVTNGEEDENKWLVPEGYLSDDEGIHVRKSDKHKRGVISRPAKWPIAGNKHFPMKPVILGPSFESSKEPENHPLSDFKMHMLFNVDTLDGYSPFIELDTEKASKANNKPFNICFEPNKSRSPLHKREIDKLQVQSKQELVNIILSNKSKTMMGLVATLKAENKFEEYTTAQLQAMIHDLAIQEVRGTSKEYNWYLR